MKLAVDNIRPDCFKNHYKSERFEGDSFLEAPCISILQPSKNARLSGMWTQGVPDRGRAVLSVMWREEEIVHAAEEKTECGGQFCALPFVSVICP
jgi:hypothetical protein